MAEKIPKPQYMIVRNVATWRSDDIRAAISLAEKQLKRIGPPAQEGDFAEVRIPRLLRYPRLSPDAKADYLQLAVCEYIAPATGTSVAYRFWSKPTTILPKGTPDEHGVSPVLRARDEAIHRALPRESST